MPAKYGKAYVERGKTDAGDAAAICEAVGVSVCPAAVDSSIRTDRPARSCGSPVGKLGGHRTHQNLESGHFGRV